MTELERVSPPHPHALDVADPEEVDSAFRAEYGARMREALRARNTHRAYDADRRHFQGWCHSHGLRALPATEKTIIAYLLYWGDPVAPRRTGDTMLRPVTLARRVSGIKAWHAAEQKPWPQFLSGEENLIAYTVEYIAREQKATSTRSRALSINKLRAAVRELPEEPLGVRNKAILLTGFYGAFRRSEITGFDLGDLVFDDSGEDDGMILHLRASKSDQKGKGRHVPINYQGTDTCPVRAMQSWLQARGTAPGPLFTNISGRSNGDRTARLHPDTVNYIIKHALQAVGEDPTRYSAHSLRSGFVTAAAKMSIPARLIRQQTGHASYEMLDHYVHSIANLSENATKYMR